MRLYLFLILIFTPTFMLWANEHTDDFWKAQLSSYKLPFLDQAYCYTSADGTLLGSNLDQRVRLASVSKLITSLWSLETLGAQFKYKTRLFIKDNSMHIEGSYDPFMGNEKIFFLLSQLNNLGFNHFTKITFDKNFIVFPNVQGHIEEQPRIDESTITKNLSTYFNTNAWPESMKGDYARVSTMAGSRMKKTVNFTVEKIEATLNNPFEDDQSAQVLTLSSPPLFRYLKEMNVESNNFVAQILFLHLGGEKYFTNYVSEKYNYGPKVLRFFSGSGLPVIEFGIRYDNYATCSSMMRLIGSLKEKMENERLDLEDVMAVPGSDQGTFRNRIFPSDYKNAFVAKTGTLMHTSTLAGALSTKSGISFYGIFNQSTDIESSKKVQNEMIRVLMSEMGGPLAFNYKVLPFDTYGDEDIKSFLIRRSEFLPFEENLY